MTKCLTAYTLAFGLFGVMFSTSMAGEGAEQQSPTKIGSRLQLFLDHELIQEMKGGVRLVMHRPIPAEVVQKLDRPWEGCWTFAPIVLKDGPTYRMCYRGMNQLIAGDLGVTCYAESKDGIHWTRPNLGLVAEGGSSDNNIILPRSIDSMGFMPFIDTKPGVPASERFKALVAHPTNPRGTARLYYSADGIHWKVKPDKVTLVKPLPGAFDAMNCCWWSEDEDCYVCFTRHYPGYRSICRMASKDLIHWGKMEPMDCGANPKEQLYEPQIAPYFRNPSIYIALSSRFCEGHKVLTDEQLRAIDTPAWARSDCNDILLLTTRPGSTVFSRTFKEAFIRPGIGLKNWTSRGNYAGRYIVPTSDTEMSIYLVREYGYPSVHHRRYTLRIDGFASADAPYEGGELVSRPVVFSGSQLVVNYSTSCVGGVRVELQDSGGKPIPGFTLEEAVPIVGDEIERVVSWKAGSNVEKLAGQAVRLRFVLKDADLFSFRFRYVEFGSRASALRRWRFFR